MDGSYEQPDFSAVCADRFSQSADEELTGELSVFLGDYRSDLHTAVRLLALFVKDVPQRITGVEEALAGENMPSLKERK